MSFPTRVLGRNGPRVSAVGFGTMSLAGAYGTPKSQQDQFQVLDRAHEIGARFWDTADVYGDSEKCIGEWFARTGKRNDIFLATKVGFQIKDGARVECTDPTYIKEACEKSLKTLGIDTIDLLYLHRIDKHTPIEASIEAMVQLKNEGKIRYLGISECSANTLRRATAVHQISAYEVEYSPFCLEIENPQIDALNACRENGIAVVAYSPVGRGLLTGQIKSFDELPENDTRRMTAKYSADNFPKILDLVSKFKHVADELHLSVAQVCIAWLMAQGDDIIPIPGTKTIKYLEENTAAALIELSKDQVDSLRSHVDATDLPGARYPAAFVDSLFRESEPL